MAVETTQDLTELNAVNSVLAAIGQSPVTTLDYSNPETSFVYNLIQECSRDVQDEGWVFNREYMYPLTPDANGEIQIPANILRMDVSENDVYRFTMWSKEMASYTTSILIRIKKEEQFVLISYGYFHSLIYPAPSSGT